MATQLLAKGMGASPGRATGGIVFCSDDAVAAAEKGIAVILVRVETDTEDLPGMKAAAGIVTTRGGITSDAAIIARSLGKPCIASCLPLRVDYAAGSLTIWREAQQDSAAHQDRADVVLAKGDVITIDGGRGEIWAGE